LGYSGWGKTQLSAEIEEKSWLVVKTKIDVLHFDAKTLWKELIMEMGGDYVLWANAPSDPMLN
jgi:putative transcriptional regulator